MFRRPFCGMAVAFILGILSAVYESAGILFLCAGVLLLGIFFTFRRKILLQKRGANAHKRGVVFIRLLLILLMLFLGRERYQEEIHFTEQYRPWLEEGMQLMVQGKLSSKEYKNNQYIYYLTSCQLGLYQENISNKQLIPCNQVLIYSESDTYSIGEILIVNGTIQLWKSAVNEGNFDEKSFYELQKMDFKMKEPKVLAVYGKENQIAEGLFQLRMRLRDIYGHTLALKDSGILATIVLGDKSMLDVEQKKLYQTAGISHILAISGLHISLIGMSGYRLFRRLHMGSFSAGAIAGSFLFCYGIMVGMGTSVQRALVMFFLSIIAQAVGRSYDSLNALGVAAVFILWGNPLLIFYAGFLFSFLAVIGTVWIGQSMQTKSIAKGNEKNPLSGQEKGKRNKKRGGRIEKIKDTLAVSLSIQLSTLPLAAWYYYEIPIYAILVNLAALPFLGVLLFFGMLGGAAGLLSLQVAELLLVPCCLILSGYQKLCEFCNQIPGAVLITGRPEFWKMAVYYMVLMLMTVYRYRLRRMQIQPHHCYIYIFFRRVLMGALMLLILFFHSERGFELDVLDVGQGDASFIRTNEGSTIFVDGGSTDVKKIGEYRILPFLKSKGVRRVDYWFVSHTDMDHVSGLKEILKMGYPVRYLVFSEEVEREEAYLELVEIAQERGTLILYMRTGDVLHLGDARIQVLFPEGKQIDKNAASLVISYEEEDFTGIFTGDIGIAQEHEILAGKMVETIGAIDFYKAAHHGSKGSNSKDFLSHLAPTISSVSCGVSNRYGHPSTEAIENMEEAGSKVFYTMYEGQIKITVEGEQMIVQRYRVPLDEFCFSVIK